MKQSSFASDAAASWPGATGTFWGRWWMLVVVGVALSTGLGGAGDGTVTVEARPPDRAVGQAADGDACHAVRGCEVSELGEGAPDPDPDGNAASTVDRLAEATREPAADAATDPTTDPSPEATHDPSSVRTGEPSPDPTTVASAGATREPSPVRTAQPSPDPITDPTPKADPAPPPAPTREPADTPRSATRGLWLSHAEIAVLPTSGAAWRAVLDDANGNWGVADVRDQDSRHDTRVFAGALVAVRLNDASMRTRVVEALATVPGTEQGGRTLALGRNLVGYVLAADLVGYRDPAFVDWVDRVRHTELDGRTLVSTHETRPNNWGTHAGASRIAAALYLGDQTDLDRAARVFAGWLGDREAYAGFRYGDLDWQCDPKRPVPINPAGCTIDGRDAGGVLPDDQRRGGTFTWPPPQVNYSWGALQGATVQAQLLSRAGYNAWGWSDRALVRALEWLYSQADFPAVGDDTWIPWLVNHATGTSYPTLAVTRHGKNLGYTDWTHAR